MNIEYQYILYILIYKLAINSLYEENEVMTYKLWYKVETFRKIWK